MSRNSSLGSAQGGLWKDFWWLDKSRYSSETCEMGSPLPEGVITLAPGRGDMQLPIGTCPWLHIKARAGLQAPSVPTTSQSPGHPGRLFPAPSPLC